MNDVSGPYIFWIENFLERNQPSAHKLFNNLEIFDVAIRKSFYMVPIPNMRPSRAANCSVGIMDDGVSWTELDASWYARSSVALLLHPSPAQHLTQSGSRRDRTHLSRNPSFLSTFISNSQGASAQRLIIMKSPVVSISEKRFQIMFLD